jgi:hypothetical protein
LVYGGVPLRRGRRKNLSGEEIIAMRKKYATGVPSRNWLRPTASIQARYGGGSVGSSPPILDVIVLPRCPSPAGPRYWLSVRICLPSHKVRWRCECLGARHLHHLDQIIVILLADWYLQTFERADSRRALSMAIIRTRSTK